MSTPPPPSPEPAGFTQDVQYSQATARVPERVGRGVFASAVLVMQGPYEFVLDFLLRVNQPFQLAARIVIPFALMPSFINALQDNLANYTQRFGPPPPLPPIPPGTPMPRIDEIYDQLKIPEETMVGSYANAVLIIHTPAEFCFDFVTNFYPRSAVSQRVFMSAFHIPRFLDSLVRSFNQFQQKVAQAQQPPPPPTT